MGHRRRKLGVLGFCRVGFSLREALASLSRIGTARAQAGRKSRGHRRPNLEVLVLYCGVGFSLREALASLSRMSTGDAQAGLKSRAG
jgi:hypothetical protein